MADIFVSCPCQDRICLAPLLVAERSSQGMPSWIESDPDLDPIRPDPRFYTMIARARLVQKAPAESA